MQLLGTKRLRDGRQMLPAGGYSEPTENQGIMDMATGEIIALSKKDQRIADAKKNRKQIMEELQAKVDKENAEKTRKAGKVESMPLSELQGMSYDQLSRSVDRMNARRKEIGKELDGYEKGSMGITLNKDDRWRSLRAEGDRLGESIRQANDIIDGKYQVEHRAKSVRATPEDKKKLQDKIKRTTTFASQSDIDKAIVNQQGILVSTSGKAKGAVSAGFDVAVVAVPIRSSVGNGKYVPARIEGHKKGDYLVHTSKTDGVGSITHIPSGRRMFSTKNPTEGRKAINEMIANGIELNAALQDPTGKLRDIVRKYSR